VSLSSRSAGSFRLRTQTPRDPAGLEHRTAFVDDLFGKLLFKEIKGERVERRTTVNHAMKTARTAWNTVSRANPRVFPPKNPFDLHDDDEAKQDAQMKRIKRRAKLAKQAIVK
jgi:hypothetical protein